MKSITKLMVVAMLLVAALVVAPAVAAPRSVSAGGTIYVGEENLNLDAVFVTNATGALVYSPGESNEKIMRIGNTTAFDLLPAYVGDTKGLWYAYNTSKDSPQKGGAGSAGSVYIEIPSSNLDVVLDGSSTSIDGKSVTRGQKIQFKLSNNLDGLKGVATMEIEVTGPGGGTVTTFEGTDLTITDITEKLSKSVNLRNATAGTYTAKGVIKNLDKSTSTGFNTNTVTFEVTTGALAVKADKDSVVRGNSFSVTITGESKRDYNVTVVSADPKDPTASPMIAPGQTAFAKGAVFGETNITVTTDAGGIATIQFNTTKDTADKTFTIEVQETFDEKRKDEVKVKVEAGSVTITSSGTGTYYIGEEITFSGTCTDSKEVFLFVTGPNLGTNGVNLTHLEPVEKDKAGTFTKVNVDADDTWTKKWNTADLNGKSIDAGGYTVYAVSKPYGKDDGLSDAKYAMTSVNLRTGFLSVDPIGASVAKGDDLKITGTAQGKPDNVYIWIFGKNYYGKTAGLDVKTVSVESDSSFEEKIKTDSLAAGQYFVIVQHPMGVKSAPNQAGSIMYNVVDTGVINGTGINTVKLTNLQAPAAASALIEVLESPNIPDTYVKLTFFVEEAFLFIDPVGTKEAGSKFTITGTTNLAAGGTLSVDVTSAAFQPGQKTEASAFSSAAGTAVIEKGDGVNKWSYEVDATGFRPDQYVVKVESIEAKTTNTATFNLVEAGEAPATTPPAGETTTPPAGETTTPPAGETTTTTEPAPTPGFGALVALAGLGAVAFLVLRRK